MAISEKAEIAKIIRKELKGRGIKGKVSCLRRCNPERVQIDLFDASPETVKQISSFSNQIKPNNFNVGFFISSKSRYGEIE